MDDFSVTSHTVVHSRDSSRPPGLRPRDSRYTHSRVPSGQQSAHAHTRRHASFPPRGRRTRTRTRRQPDDYAHAIGGPGADSLRRRSIYLIYGRHRTWHRMSGIGGPAREVERCCEQCRAQAWKSMRGRGGSSMLAAGGSGRTHLRCSSTSMEK